MNMVDMLQSLNQKFLSLWILEAATGEKIREWRIPDTLCSVCPLPHHLFSATVWDWPICYTYAQCCAWQDMKFDGPMVWLTKRQFLIFLPLHKTNNLRQLIWLICHWKVTVVAKSFQGELGYQQSGPFGNHFTWQKSENTWWRLLRPHLTQEQLSYRKARPGLVLF